LHRITNGCYYSAISDIATMPDDEHLLITINGEEFSISNKMELHKFYKLRKRDPIKNSGLFVVDINNGSLQQIQIKGDERFNRLFNNEWHATKFIANRNNKYLIVGYGEYFKLDLETKTLTPFIDSVNGYKYGQVDSLRIYNLVSIGDDKKLMAGNGSQADYHFILFDIEKKRIEKDYYVDTNKFIPSFNRSIMRKF
jgi:hypothetical protein